MPKKVIQISKSIKVPNASQLRHAELPKDGPVVLKEMERELQVNTNFLCLTFIPSELGSCESTTIFDQKANSLYYLTIWLFSNIVAKLLIQ